MTEPAYRQLFPGYEWITLTRSADGVVAEMKLTVRREDGQKVLITREMYEDLKKNGWGPLSLIPEECLPWMEYTPASPPAEDLLQDDRLPPEDDDAPF